MKILSDPKQHVLDKAKTIIQEEIAQAGYKVKKILLFGSRARNETRKGSDWDFFVVIDRDIPFPQQRPIITRIRRRFVKKGFYGDVFLQSKAAVQERAKNTGYLAYYALKEGIEI